MMTNIATVLLYEKLQEIQRREIKDTPAGTVLVFPRYTEDDIKAFWADGTVCL